MGIADRIYELVKGLPDAEASRVLQFVQRVSERHVTIARAHRQIDLALFRHYRGCYDGSRIDREALYDRAGLR